MIDTHIHDNNMVFFCRSFMISNLYYGLQTIKFTKHAISYYKSKGSSKPSL